MLLIHSFLILCLSDFLKFYELCFPVILKLLQYDFYHYKSNSVFLLKKPVISQLNHLFGYKLILILLNILVAFDTINHLIHNDNNDMDINDKDIKKLNNIKLLSMTFGIRTSAFLLEWAYRVTKLSILLKS